MRGWGVGGQAAAAAPGLAGRLAAGLRAAGRSNSTVESLSTGAAASDPAGGSRPATLRPASPLQPPEASAAVARSRPARRRPSCLVLAVAGWHTASPPAPTPTCAGAFAAETESGRPPATSGTPDSDGARGYSAETLGTPHPAWAGCGTETPHRSRRVCWPPVWVMGSGPAGKAAG